MSCAMHGATPTKLGVDSIWFWDHFYPLYGDPDGNQFECWSLLAAAAIETKAPQIGPMVTSIGYRNPDLIAYMWNASGSADEYAHKSSVLDEWCRKVGRDPNEIERSANVNPRSARDVKEWLGAGLQHFVLRLAKPFDTKALERLLKESRA